jgi:hypothetical protein
MKTSVKFLTGLAALLVIAGVLFLRHALAPRIVARAVTPDGIEMCVLQRCTWDVEFFNTCFVFHKPGQPWKWFYYDHEDDYWGTARFTLDMDGRVATVYRRGKPAITFDWQRELYTLHRFRDTRDNPLPKPPGWSPATEGYR